MGFDIRGAGVVSGGGVFRHSHGQEAWEVFGGGVCGAARRPTSGLCAPEEPILHGQALRGGLQSQEDGEPPLLDKHDSNDCMDACMGGHIRSTSWESSNHENSDRMYGETSAQHPEKQLISSLDMQQSG